MKQIETGIIGGSGFYHLEELTENQEHAVSTPYGNPSDRIMTGRFRGEKVAFLARHGRGHRMNPSEVNYRANIFALKAMGAKRIISVTAVGSLKEHLPPSHLVIPDQYVDYTYKREKTFFENGIVAHVSMAEPTCPCLTRIAAESATRLDIPFQEGGTYVNMEGPQFSSQAESLSYRRMGFDIIGMTQAVEAKLAKEMEMCFLPLAFVTDYDCWHEEEGPVSADMVVRVLKQNIANSIQLIGDILAHLPASDCSCADALQNALMSTPETFPPEVRQRLALVLNKYIGREE